MSTSTMVILALLVLSSVLLPRDAETAGYHKVEGYRRKNGTYVRPHYRSNPDGIRSNNFGGTGKPAWMRAEERVGYAPHSGGTSSAWNGEAVLGVLFAIIVVIIIIAWIAAAAEGKDYVPRTAAPTSYPKPRRSLGSGPTRSRSRRRF